MDCISKRDAIELVQLNYSYREARDFVWQTIFPNRVDEELQIRKAIKLNKALRLAQDKTGIEAVSHRMLQKNMIQFYDLLKSL
jgi:hypothetical protein